MLPPPLASKIGSTLAVISQGAPASSSTSGVAAASETGEDEEEEEKPQLARLRGEVSSTLADLRNEMRSSLAEHRGEVVGALERAERRRNSTVVPTMTHEQAE